METLKNNAVEIFAALVCVGAIVWSLVLLVKYW